jgi:hypothetical protein
MAQAGCRFEFNQKMIEGFMRSCWNFYFQSIGVVFERPLEFSGEMEVTPLAAACPPTQRVNFDLVVELDPSPKFSGMRQTGTIKITLSGNSEQTRDHAYQIAEYFSEKFTFASGEIRLLGGLITGVHIPDNLDEEEQLGEKRYFAVAHLIRDIEPPTLNEASLEWLSAKSENLLYEKQFNSAISSTLSIFGL